MSMGAFSLSLNVRNIETSFAFYRKLGFRQLGGRIEDKWLILTNGDTVIGLFEGMFEKNMLIFTPGWDKEGRNVDPFEDVRDIQKRLKAQGIALDAEADPGTSGPAHVMLTDPDGNPILIDQHR
ncbi:VOC family protein [Pelagibacterium xiamenense]|uniref:VOC family protein n=1 Tax=Pelagibacterium xiamenense TaxID=2901140 RepID=UPI001E304453|nr:VOC family protein [Pelagibacterium xiamenense]MCD7060066.1 VOC family protein [Pelagibacterium xiamenense]